LTEPVRSKCPEICLIKLGQMLTNRSEALGIFRKFFRNFIFKFLI